MGLLRELSLHIDVKKGAAHGPDGMTVLGGSCSTLHCHPAALILPCSSLGSVWAPEEAQWGFHPTWISATVGLLCSLLQAGAEELCRQQPFGNYSSISKIQVFSWSFL